MKETKEIETRHTLEFSYAEILGWIRAGGWLPESMSPWNVTLTVSEGSGGGECRFDEHSSLQVSFVTKVSEGDDATD